MATPRLENSRVILRFRFGKNPYQARQRFENTYRYIVERAAVSFANSTGERAIYELRDRVVADLLKELRHQASLYQRYIIGAPGTLNKPSGTLTGLASGSPSQSLGSALPEWKARNREYLKRKRKHQGSIAWFTTAGWMQKNYIKENRLSNWANVDNWEADFGPITVEFEKRKDIESEVDATIQTVPGKRNVQFVVGKVIVKALGNITPDMLGNLSREGPVTPYTGAGNPGLLRYVDNEAVRRKLAGRSYKYRPTLEPFLNFFLTRALPAAVTARFASGGMKKING